MSQKRRNGTYLVRAQFTGRLDGEGAGATKPRPTWNRRDSIAGLKISYFVNLQLLGGNTVFISNLPDERRCCTGRRTPSRSTPQSPAAKLIMPDK